MGNTDQTTCQLCSAAGAPLVTVPHYGLHICPPCEAKHQAGWPVAYEPMLMAGLARSGLFIPDRNQHGLLPFTYQPPADFNI